MFMLITSTRLEPMFSFGGRVVQYKIYAKTEDGIERSLFSFFTDEKNYNEKTFVGMTVIEAFEKFKIDDDTYLRG